MAVVIGIRQEDKSPWEARAPLAPEEVEELTERHGVRFQVQHSPYRVFGAQQYRNAGAEVVSDLDACPVILGVKEIPAGKLAPGKTYLYFSHTIKGQPDNMPALRRLIELGCTLIDYERIADNEGRRLVFFGRFAGLAGMIDSLRALGRRLQSEAIANPFARVRPAYEYGDLDEVRHHFALIGEEIREAGLPAEIQPFVCGFAGYGQVSRGAREIFDLLPVTRVRPDELAQLPRRGDTCFATVFDERHLVEPVEASRPFELRDYYDHPERYRAALFPYLKHLTVFINAIYWDPRYPRFLTREQLRELYEGQPRLRVIGDITCDIDGSLACTVRATTPDNPVYVYDPFSGEATDGFRGRGPVVLAVDFLPCELPVDASRHFSKSLAPFIPALDAADLSAPLEASGLPAELARAVIVHNGELTEPYRYLEKHL